jgi:hypothetical protein
MTEYTSSSHVTEDEAGGTKECYRKEAFYLREALREMRDHCRFLEEEIGDLQLALKKEKLSKIPVSHLNESNKEEARRFLLHKEEENDTRKSEVDIISNREEPINGIGVRNPQEL